MAIINFTLGVNVNGALDDTTGVMTVTGTGDMYDYNYDSSPFFQNSVITSVVVESGVTTVGDWVFYSCPNLTSATISDTVISIGEGSFTMSNLTSVSLGNSVETIGQSTFSKNMGLSTIDLPDSLTSIGVSAFYECSNLSSITLPPNLATIGQSAFAFCMNLTTITNNYNGNQTVGAFFLDGISMSGTASVYNSNTNFIAMIPDGWTVEYLPDETFTLGTNVIGERYGSQLTVSGTGAMTDFASQSSPLYGNTAILTVVIEGGVTNIGTYTFQGLGITEATIPDGLTSIGNSAFNGCSSLSSLTIGANVESIGTYAFYGSSSLTSVTLPDSLLTIGGSAFKNSGLSSLTIPDNVTSIGYGSFMSSVLTSLVIGSSVSFIDSFAFSQNYELNSITNKYIGNQTIPADDGMGMEGYSFSNIYATGTAYADEANTNFINALPAGWTIEPTPDAIYELGANVEGLLYGTNLIIRGTGAMADYASGGSPLYLSTIETVVFEEGVTSIGTYLFQSCEQLKSVKLTDSLISIGLGSFNTCSSLREITITKNISNVGGYAFVACHSLVKVINKYNGNQTIGDNLFHLITTDGTAYAYPSNTNFINSTPSTWAVEDIPLTVKVTTQHGVITMATKKYVDENGGSVDAIDEVIADPIYRDAETLAGQQPSYYADIVNDITPELGGSLNAGDNNIYFTERDNGNSGASVTIDWTKSNKQKVVLTDNAVISFVDPEGASSLVLKVIQDATGGRTAGFPTSKTPGGKNVTLTTEPNAVDILSIYYDGTGYFIVPGLNFQ